MAALNIFDNEREEDFYCFYRHFSDGSSEVWLYFNTPARQGKQCCSCFTMAR